MRSGGGPARFSITGFLFLGGRDRFAFVVVVLISLTFRTDVKKREGAWIQVSDLVKRPIGSNCSGTGPGEGK